MAGSVSADYSSTVGSLTTAGVKIFAVGIGALFVQSQLIAMAVSSSYVLNAASFSGLAGIRGSVSTLISQGIHVAQLSCNLPFYKLSVVWLKVTMFVRNMYFSLFIIFFSWWDQYHRRSSGERR